MKTKIVAAIWGLALLLTILADRLPPADASPAISAMPRPLLYEKAVPLTSSLRSPAAFAPPQASRHSLISAQQACLQGKEWNWRQGRVPICFKAGHARCPAGYPWMRQKTQRYTICLSASHSRQMSPALGTR